MPEEHESKQIKVYGDKHFKEYARTHPVPAAYERYINARSVTFTCKKCARKSQRSAFQGQ